MAHVYTPGIDQRDGLGGALHIAGVDALGTVRAFINDDGGQAVTDTFGAYAYGIPRNRTGSDAFTFAFAGADGYQTDPNGLVLLGNRVYHVYTGRFLTRDPAGAGDNDYEYAFDNPLSYADPTGLDASDIPDIVNNSYGKNVSFPGVNSQVNTDGNGDIISGQSIIAAEATLMMSPGAGPGSASKLVGLGDSLLLNGAGSHYASVSSAYIRGDVGLGALVGASVLMVGAAAINLIPGEEEGNAALHGAEAAEEAVTAAKEAGALKPIFYRSNKAAIDGVKEFAKVDEYAASDAIHAFKKNFGMRPNDNFGLDEAGGLWIKKTGEFTEAYITDYL